ncbi:MAG: BatD family protein, partial [Muribaculaceae bacterium]|nr:BatD family protein [Muribaculaceae bacterium]
NYYTAVISRSLLYPQRSGEITLGGGEYTVNVYREMIVNDFPFPRRVMDDKDVTVKPRSATLHVNALPSPQPAGFSGAVGQFSAETRLVGNTFKTNEAATLLYTISGTGNIKYLKEPTLDLPSEFELYDPHVDNTAHVSGRNMTGTMTVDYTFVPQTVGNFRIGGSDFVYFDPAKRDYVSIALPSYEIEVTQGANVSSQAVAFHDKRDIEAKNTDIHFIKPGANRPAVMSKYMADTLWFWLTFPIGIIVFAAVLLMLRKSLAARSDVKARRLNKAGKVARRRLAAASKALAAKHYDKFYEELLRALQGYLADKLQIAGSQLNRDNISATLLADGASTELTDSLVHVLDECEMARYTPQISSEQADRTYSEATEIINSIESLKRK